MSDRFLVSVDYPCVNNQLVFNAVKEWGQGGTSYGHNGSIDAACMYMYGHCECSNVFSASPYLVP